MIICILGNRQKKNIDLKNQSSLLREPRLHYKNSVNNQHQNSAYRMNISQQLEQIGANSMDTYSRSLNASLALPLLVNLKKKCKINFFRIFICKIFCESHQIKFHKMHLDENAILSKFVFIKNVNKN